MREGLQDRTRVDRDARARHSAPRGPFRPDQRRFAQIVRHVPIPGVRRALEGAPARWKTRPESKTSQEPASHVDPARLFDPPGIPDRRRPSARGRSGGDLGSQGRTRGHPVERGAGSHGPGGPARKCRTEGGCEVGSEPDRAADSEAGSCAVHPPARRGGREPGRSRVTRRAGSDSPDGRRRLLRTGWKGGPSRSRPLRPRRRLPARC